MNLFRTFLVIFALITTNANAGLIDTNNDSFIDEATQLEWIDFGINNNQSYSYVVSQLGIGGVYEGWRLPTKDEVYTMWANAFLGLGALHEEDYFTAGQGRVVDGAGVKGSTFANVFNIIGYNALYLEGEDDEVKDTIGVYQSTNGLAFIRTIERTREHISLPNGYDEAHHNDEGNLSGHVDQSYINMSTLLIKVPEPTTLSILALGLLGLVSRRNKKSL